MEHFYIYKIKKEFTNIFQQYPVLIEQILNQNMNNFVQQQINLIFDSNEEVHHLIQNNFKDREDYHFFSNTHYLKNNITGATSIIQVRPHCIYGVCSKNFYALRNIILQSNENYVILEKK